MGGAEAPDLLRPTIGGGGVAEGGYTHSRQKNENYVNHSAGVVCVCVCVCVCIYIYVYMQSYSRCIL